MTAVSMGNPHAVIYVDMSSNFPLEIAGPGPGTSPAVPAASERAFVDFSSPGEVRMRTWERGSGITLACGTGACAVCVAGVLTGRTGRQILAHLPGGELELDWPDRQGARLHDRPGDRGLQRGMALRIVASGEWRVARNSGEWRVTSGE